MKRKLLALVLALILLTSAVECALADLPCGACQQRGWVKCSHCVDGYVVRGVPRTGYVKSPCSFCHQTGQVRCNACGGDGRIGSSDPGASGGGSGGGSGEHTASLSKTSLTLIAGRSETLKVDWASGAVQWSSSNRAVATVSSGGKVKAQKAGRCTITAKTGSQTLTCQVTVNKRVYAKGIKLSSGKATLLPGGSVDLGFTVSPDTSTITEPWSVSWSTGRDGVATVDDSGRVTGRNPGKAVITAKLKIKKGKSKKAKCTVTVESGLTRFKRWFSKHCSTVGKNKVYYSGDNDQIIYSAGKGTWTFCRHEETYNGYQDVSITFKKDFTGDAHISFYWYRSGAYTGVSELECTATQSTRSLSRNTRYDWSFTKGGSYSERDVADANVASLLSGMQVLLKFDAKLDAKEGWKDLGLIGY